MSLLRALFMPGVSRRPRSAESTADCLASLLRLPSTAQGHGICGLARFSLRSVTAVMSFMLAAMLTATALEVNRPAFLVDVPTSVPGLQRMADVPNSNTPLFALIFGCIAAVIAIALIIYMWVADSPHEGIHTALAAAAGAVFSVGMGVGGMLNRGIIVSFLALAPGWNVRLAFVMGGGVTVAVGAFYWVKVRHSQLLASVGEACPATSAGEDMTPDEKEALTFLRRKYQVPTNTLVNFQLVFGAVVFGVGWGISGLCPGPALGLMSAGVARAWLWLPGFALGSWAWAWLEHALAQAGHRAGAGAPAPAAASPRPASPERPSVATARAVLQTAAAAVKDTQDVETGNTAGLLAHAQPACGPASMDALRAALPEDVHPVLCAALLAAAEEVQEEGTPSPRPRSASPRVSPELGAAEVAPEGAIDAVSRV